MPEIRRITVPEAAAVAELWDRMCREVPDGGPLTVAGRQNIQRMLAICAWHHSAFCLVAVDGDRLVGFVMGRLDPGDGLLPSVAGQIEELYVPAESAADGSLARQLVEAAIGTLRERGARGTIYHLTAADDPDHEPFAGLGFDADMVRLSLYREGADEC
jgi:ribosomal protein S18 acetylase RimI-like enzyme